MRRQTELNYIIQLYFRTNEIKKETDYRQYITDVIDILRMGSILYFEVFTSNETKSIYQECFDELFIRNYHEYMKAYSNNDGFSEEHLSRYYEELILRKPCLYKNIIKEKKNAIIHKIH